MRPVRSPEYDGLCSHDSTPREGRQTFPTMASVALQQQLDSGAVPNHISNVCPEGTKFWILEVGWLEADEGFVTRGGNTSLFSTKDVSFVNKRRQLPMYCVLIEHPIEGVILWETGCGKTVMPSHPDSSNTDGQPLLPSFHCITL